MIGVLYFLAEIKDARQLPSEMERALRQCGLMDKLGGGAKDDDRALAVLAEALADNEGWDNGGGWDPHWEFVGDHARDALALAGLPAVAFVIPKLGDADERCRRRALDVVFRIGDDARAALAAVQPLLDDPVREVRAVAVSTFGRLLAKDPARIATLDRMLAGPASSKVTALRISASFEGEDRLRLVDRFIALLADDAREVRLEALHQLQGMWTPADRALPAIMAFVEGTDPELANAALNALVWCRDDRGGVIQMWLRFLSDPAKRARAISALSIREAREIQPLVPELLRRIGEGGSDDLIAIFKAVAADAPREVIALVGRRLAALDLEHMDPHAAILWVVEAMGPAARDMLPSLERLSQHADQYVRVNAGRVAAALAGK